MGGEWEGERKGAELESVVRKKGKGIGGTGGQAASAPPL